MILSYWQLFLSFLPIWQLFVSNSSLPCVWRDPCNRDSRFLKTKTYYHMTYYKIKPSTHGRSTNHVATSAQRTPAVNVIETDGNYRLELAAPGLTKDVFNISLDKQVLSISVKTEEPETPVNYKRRDFGPYNFERSFQLPDTVDMEAIDAQYEQGILVVTLPRKAELAPKQIAIS